jgi:hypothetical protein
MLQLHKMKLSSLRVTTCVYVATPPPAACPTPRTAVLVEFLGRLQRAVMTLEDMPLGYREMLSAASALSVILHGAWHRGLPGDLPQPLGVGRVTFVGDAALPIRPVTGMCGWRTRS